MDRLVAKGLLGRLSALSVLAALIICTAPTAVHAAKKSIVVMGISGPRGGQATRLITRFLAGRYRLVGRGSFDWLIGKTGSTCLIVLGLAGLLLFTVPSLLAIVVGTAAKIHRAGIEVG